MIVCENLVKIYSLSGVEVVALQGLDLTVQNGDMVGIVGASGSGKSTLLNVLGGLDRPSAGQVLVGERNLLKMSDSELDVYRRTQVGFVWQQTMRNLVPYLTTLENVELPMRLTPLSHAKRRQRASELLETLGLVDRMRHRPAELSGGEQQRVAIAVALANHPLILLADEPTGEVDTATALEIYAALRKVNQNYGMTVLIVSHDINISRYTNRVVAIRDGKTSTETVRATGMDIPRPDGEWPKETHKPDQRKHIEFEELVVLDSAGRLQIPRDYLETLNIGDRVRLEVKGADIVIHPVAGRGRTAASELALPNPDELYVDEEDTAPEKKKRSLTARLRRILKSPSQEVGSPSSTPRP